MKLKIRSVIRLLYGEIEIRIKQLINVRVNTFEPLTFEISM